jgi:hypothetical protein
MDLVFQTKAGEFHPDQGHPRLQHEAYPAASVRIPLAKQLKAILNPTTSSLHAVAPELDLFDTHGSLQQQSALVLLYVQSIPYRVIGPRSFQASWSVPEPPAGGR